MSLVLEVPQNQKQLVSFDDIVGDVDQNIRAYMKTVVNPSYRSLLTFVKTQVLHDSTLSGADYERLQEHVFHSMTNA